MSLISKWSSVIQVKSLSVKIDILASLGISILIPDMPVTSVFVQSIIILVQHLVSILTLSFGIGLDKQMFVGK